MYELQLPNAYLNFGLIVVDVQNGFVSKGGSYDKLGMNTGVSLTSLLIAVVVVRMIYFVNRLLLL